MWINAIAEGQRFYPLASPNRLFKCKKTKAFGLALLTYYFGRVGRRSSQPYPHQKTNRYAVGGDIAIRFLSNLSQKTSSFIPNSCKQFAKDLLLCEILLTTKRLLAKPGIVIGLLQGGCYVALADCVPNCRRTFTGRLRWRCFWRRRWSGLRRSRF